MVCGSSLPQNRARIESHYETKCVGYPDGRGETWKPVTKDHWGCQEMLWDGKAPSVVSLGVRFVSAWGAKQDVDPLGLRKRNIGELASRHSDKRRHKVTDIEWKVPVHR